MFFPEGQMALSQKAVGDNEGLVALHIQVETSVPREVIKRLHYPLDVMLVCVRWYAAYALSLRNLEEMMAERGVIVDHATVHRWALKIRMRSMNRVLESQAVR